jgi:hypothetical protein
LALRIGAASLMISGPESSTASGTIRIAQSVHQIHDAVLAEQRIGTARLGVK